MMKQLINNELHFDGFRNKFGMTGCAEHGRSMVEMLGVLAVMGVLSVAGVGGYTAAMNKHRANELLNEASKRATIVAMQMASGKDANIDEFKVNGTQDFTVSGKAGDTTFTLTIKNADEAICRQLVNVAGTTGMVRKITSDGTDTTGDANKCTTGDLVLTYNTDLSNKNLSSSDGSESNIDTGTCESDIVKVYNCTTKTTTDCCPDTEDCTQPTDCACDESNQCPGDQVCENNVCICPEGYNYDGNVVRGSLGKDGQTCCAPSGQPYMDGYYDHANISACGCPTYDENAGEVVMPEAINGTCCYNGFAAEESEEGGDISTATYNTMNPTCGCPPDPNHPESRVEVINGTCCSMGKTWSNNVYNYEHVDLDKCGCPTDPSGYTPSDVDLGIVPVRKGNTCCYNGHELDDDWEGNKYYHYATFNYALCGECPYADLVVENDNPITLSGYKKGIRKNDTCCLEGFSITAGGDYATYNPSLCGCPSVGNTPGNIEEAGAVGIYTNGVCCYRGWAYSGEQNYYDTDISHCGCPTTSQGQGILKNGLCCLNGMYLFENGEYTTTEPYPLCQE